MLEVDRGFSRLEMESNDVPEYAAIA